jgi:hypothetical protein
MSNHHNEAAKEWNLSRLYSDLATVNDEDNPPSKKSVLETHKEYLCLLLMHVSPKEIAEKKNLRVNTVRDTLSQKLYPYIQKLVNHIHQNVKAGAEKKIRDWRDVPIFLADYRIQKELVSLAEISELPSRGWMWLGRVKKEGNIKLMPPNGTPLIPGRGSNQPVTIIPETVPSKGQKVYLSTTVNIRDMAPFIPPHQNQYITGDRLGSLKSGTKIVILDLQTHIDSSDLNYIMVWASVWTQEVLTPP